MQREPGQRNLYRERHTQQKTHRHQDIGSYREETHAHAGHTQAHASTRLHTMPCS